MSLEKIVFIASSLLGTVLFLIGIILIAGNSKKYKDYTDALNSSSHPLKGIYPIGYFLLDALKYKYNTKLDKKRILQCEILYDKLYGFFYYQANLAEKLSFAYMLLAATFFIAPISKQLPAFAVGIGVCALAVWYIDTTITDKIEARERNFKVEFPQALSTLTLLVNAGMIVREAWEVIAFGNKGIIYEEMARVSQDIKKGVSEIDAYIDFSIRCGTPQIKKFSSMLVQNLSKGNRELVEFFRQITAEAWEDRKHYAKRQGESASSKLMIPIGIMFAGILVIILVPIIGSF